MKIIRYSGMNREHCDNLKRICNIGFVVGKIQRDKSSI